MAGRGKGVKKEVKMRAFRVIEAVILTYDKLNLNGEAGNQTVRISFSFAAKISSILFMNLS